MSLPRFAACWLCLGIAAGGVLLAAEPDPSPENADGANTVQEPTAEEQILAALQQPMKRDLRGVELWDLQHAFLDDQNIPLLLDQRAIREFSVDVSARVNVKCQGWPARHALKIALGKFDLTWVIENEVLVVTTQEVAARKLVTRVYSTAELMVVRDAYGRADELFAGEWDETALVDAIKASCSPDSWVPSGGLGEAVAGKESLIVHATAPTHEEVAALLAALDQARRQQFAADAASRYRSIPLRRAQDSEMRRRTLRALETKADWDFTASLHDIADSLTAKHKLFVALDPKPLADADVDLEEPVDLKFRGITLDSALTLMLREFDLTHVVSDDGLLITTLQAAENQLVIRVYPVRDLIVDLESDGLLLRAGNLIESLQRTVEVESWQSNGGAGLVEFFPDSSCLVVAQSERVHQRVEDLLARLRAVSTYQEPPLVPPADAGELDAPRLRAYRVTAEFATYAQPTKSDPQPVAKPSAALLELVAFVKKTVEPEAWEEEGVFIQALSDRIVVNHNARIQRKLKKSLLDLEAIYPDFRGRPLRREFCGSVIPVVGDASPSGGRAKSERADSRR